MLCRLMGHAMSVEKYAQPGPYGHHRIRALAKNGSPTEAPLSVKTFRFSEQT